MALTRDFKETVKDRAARDPAFAKAMLDEAATEALYRRHLAEPGADMAHQLTDGVGVLLVHRDDEAAGVALAVDAAAAGLAVRADATRLRQVLLNLLSNAIKYNRRGGRVTVDTEAQAGWQLLRVPGARHDAAQMIGPAGRILFEPAPPAVPQVNKER